MQDKIASQLASKGISEVQLQEQLDSFVSGFPYLRLHAAASKDQGIMVLDESRQAACLKSWTDYTAQPGHKVMKFVPASGAASRMFKDLYAFMDSAEKAPAAESPVAQFFASIEQAAFYTALDDAYQQAHGTSVREALADGCYKEVLRVLLTDEGLCYGHLPKGLLLFHAYAEGSRTPMEEHLVEGAMYARNADDSVNIHFTVSHEHKALFETLQRRISDDYAQRFGVKYNISYSEQQPSTDTVAVNPDNTPFALSDGTILFRPGGHGALIENLGELDADVIFIKNIDNVVPDRLKAETVRYKQILSGLLVEVQARVFAYTQQLEQGACTADDLQHILDFTREVFCITPPGVLTGEPLRQYLLTKLRRPMRVCGMVRNVGEPGGGPFVAYNADGSRSLQILEQSQIDLDNAEAVAMFKQGTHFNPVDLVCGIKDYRGEKYHLRDFVDKSTGFISNKSKDGKPLKALELPGLWNGAMSDWLTLFVEVPLSTFNPVKTVNDLFRAEHLR